jgi:hypothetical protein
MVKWENGTWEDGIWHNGTWEDGYWKKGIWKSGKWKSGFIYDPALRKYVESNISPKEYFANKKK